VSRDIVDDQDAMLRLRRAVDEADAGRRPPLSAPELERFAREIRPDADQASIEINRRDGATAIIIRAAVRRRREPESDSRLNGLTSREREVARLVADGLTNKEIAGRLNLATSTVKDHVHNILERLQLRSRQEIVALVVSTQ
jgi:DNA-binding NarL/FixJ family response regulator